MNGSAARRDPDSDNDRVEQLRQALRIARWEISSGTSGLDRRVGLVLVAGLIAIAIVGGAVAVAGTPHDANIYGVAVETSNPYYDPVASDHRLRAVDPERARERQVEVRIGAGEFRATDSRTGRAAATAVRDAIERYNDRLMDREARNGNETAAFPVSVTLEYVDRGSLLGDQEVVPTPEHSASPTEGEEPGDSETGTPDESTTTGGGPDSTPGSTDGGGSGVSMPSIGAETLFGSTGGRPADIQPPFPFSSLVLAFAFVVPMNFVIQVYASSVLRERTNRRGELTLIAPVAPETIVTGKTLPYFAAMIAIASLTALGLGGGLVSIGAVVPIALLFLATAFVGALFARSHKELTFVLVTVSVVVTAYVFVPAVFADVHPIAAISPLTMIVRDLEGITVGARTFAFATGPMTFASIVLFYFGGGLYREEDLFAQRPIPEKVLDALARPLGGRLSVALVTILLVPFVMLAELLAVATLFVLPQSVSLPVLFVLLATIEELGKSLHLLAGFERGRFERDWRAAGSVGIASGVGFFLAEKVAVVTQLVGLPRLQEGRVAFEVLAGTGGTSAPIVLAGVLLAPLALHCLTAVVSSLGAMRSRSKYALSLGLAVLLHTAYNLTVVVALVR